METCFDGDEVLWYAPMSVLPCGLRGMSLTPCLLSPGTAGHDRAGIVEMITVVLVSAIHYPLLTVFGLCTHQYCKIMDV